MYALRGLRGVQEQECARAIYADVEMINDLGDSFSDNGYFYLRWAVSIFCNVHKIVGLNC